MKTKTGIPAIIIIITTLLGNLEIFAQQELDKAFYKFYYEHSWQFDTLKQNDLREDLILLQIGQSVSKSFSYYTYQSDSLRATPDGREVFSESLKKAFRESRATGDNIKLPYYRRMSTIVYKNNPKGHMTVTDAINRNYYKYTDDLHVQVWQVSDSTKTILDYTCQMAETDFRGRRWIAWFSHDIPISDGPWKFSGLSGLIMEVYDTEKHYHFTLVGIERVHDEPIVFSPVVLDYLSFGVFEETTRLDFLIGLALYNGNNAAFINAELGMETLDESSPNYRPNDLIERDYKWHLY